MSADASPRAKTFALILLAATQFVVVLDASIVNVALPSIGDDLELRARRPLLGRERLRPLLRRLPAARRAHGRPAGAAAHLHRGPPALRRGVAGRRARAERRHADRRAGRAGPGRRADLPRRTRDRDHHVLRGRRAQQGPRRVGRGGRSGRRRGRAARRSAHRVPRLGVGAVREHADHPARRVPRPAHPRREPRPPGRHVRHPGRGVGDRGPVDHGLRARRRRAGRLGLHADRSACLRWPRRCSPRSW